MERQREHQLNLSFSLINMTCSIGGRGRIQGRRVPEATYPNEVWDIDLISIRADEVAEIIATALG